MGEVTLTEAEREALWADVHRALGSRRGRIDDLVFNLVHDRLVAERAAADRDTALLRLAQHLTTELVDGGGWCHVATRKGERCKEPDAAVRWEDGFADIVCEMHAESARERGALVVYPRRHDGTAALDPPPADPTHGADA